MSRDAIDDAAARGAARNVNRIAALVREQQYNASRSERAGTAISRVAGNLVFVAAHVVAIVLWVAWNSIGPPAKRFDPFPFGVLTMLVSLEGVLIACFVLVAQNRMTQQADRRDHLQLQINILAEQETTMVMRMLQHMSRGLDLPPFEDHVAELASETDLGEIVREIDRKVPLE